MGDELRQLVICACRGRKDAIAINSSINQLNFVNRVVRSGHSCKYDQPPSRVKPLSSMSALQVKAQIVRL